MQHSSILTKTVAVVSAAALALSMAACGGDKNGEDTTNEAGPTVAGTTFTQMTGVTATGTLGEKPEIHFDTLPHETHSNQYAILQQGDGAVVEDGQRVCLQDLFINADDGSELSSTWDSDPADCSVITAQTMSSDYVNFFVGQKIHTTVALSFNLDESNSSSAADSSASASNSADRGQGGSLDDAAASLDFTASNVVDETDAATDEATDDVTDDVTDEDSSSTTSSVNSHYLWIFTIMSAEDPVTRAEGTEVTDLPAGLPTVTRDESTGEPSVDVSTYDGSNTFVSQDLIEGDGEVVEEGDTIEVQYAGWLTDGTQFDSSWSRGSTTSFSMDSGVIEGFKEGLVGHKVGSQVLLIVPPDMGYGDEDYSTIPGGSTLIFVVDILYKR